MAKHLSEGRAWPLFFYGQLYMMGVQAWMAAPVFLWLGPTVLALKIPLLVINWRRAAAGLAARRDVGLRAWQAGVATALLRGPPARDGQSPCAGPGRHHRAAVLRAAPLDGAPRPVVFGLVFAFGFLQREFTLFAVLPSSGSRSGRVTCSVGGDGPLAGCRAWSSSGRGKAWDCCADRRPCLARRPRPSRWTRPWTNVDVVASSLCPTPPTSWGTGWLLRENVPTYFGVKRLPAGVLIAAARPSGVRCVAALLVGLASPAVALTGRIGAWWAGPALPWPWPCQPGSPGSCC